MTVRVPRWRQRRGGESGQSIVEFALVLPVALLIIVGLIAASFLFFQRGAVHDGSTAGARMAAMQTSLQTKDSVVNGKWCESQSPISVEEAVRVAAPQVSVNALPLCAASSGGSQLVQTSPVSTKVIIQIDATPGLAAPTSVTVTLTFNSLGLGQPLDKLISFTSSTSTVPVQTP
jgi:hypothetical protein